MAGGRQVWRLMTHGESHKREEAARRCMESGRISIGWGDTGDLRKLRPRSAREIAAQLREVYGSGRGGIELWRLLVEVKPGDLVILSTGDRRPGVVEVAGPYYYAATPDTMLLDHHHLREAEPIDEDPDALWRLAAGKKRAGRGVTLRLLPNSVAV